MKVTICTNDDVADCGAPYTIPIKSKSARAISAAMTKAIRAHLKEFPESKAKNVTAEATDYED